MFNRINGDLTVFLHETGHSLDGLGAYADTPFHDAKTWLDNYNLDSNTADPYGAIQPGGEYGPDHCRRRIQRDDPLRLLYRGEKLHGYLPPVRDVADGGGQGGAGQHPEVGRAVHASFAE